MMNYFKKEEIDFIKYDVRGAYHWILSSNHLTKSNAFVKGRYQKCIVLLKEEINNLSNKKILDLGCGDGVLAYKLYKAGGEVYGVDPSKEAIKIAREEHGRRGSNVVFSLSSGYDTGFEDDFFDAVICSDVIEHIQEPERLLLEIRRILRPGGIAVISTPVRTAHKPLDKMHVFEWWEEEFRQVIGGVFPESRYDVSHPLFWMEMIARSKWHRLFVNLLSVMKNPFIYGIRWHIFVLQYAVAKKGR